MKTFLLIQILLSAALLNADFGSFDEDDSDEGFLPIWSVGSVTSRPVSSNPGLAQPVVSTLEQVLSTTRRNNAKVDFILRQLSADKTSLNNLHVDLNPVSESTHVLPWAYRRVPFYFNTRFPNIDDLPLGFRDSAELSFEIVDDDDYLSRGPVPHINADGNIDYHLQLISDHDDIPGLFNAFSPYRTARAASDLPLNEPKASDKAPETLSHGLDSDLPSKEPQASDIVPEASEVTAAKETPVAASDGGYNPAGLQGLLTGLGTIRRYRNSRVYTSNGVKTIQAPVLIGPLHLEVQGVASSVSRSPIKVMTRPIKATLSVQETGDQITSVELFGSRRMFPHYSQVTLSRSKTDPELDWNTAGRWVSHLSLEMSRIWNQGSLVENINHELKKQLAQVNQQLKKNASNYQ